MASTSRFSTRAFSGLIADLDFSVQLPADWVSHDLPPGAPDFENPTVLAPLAVVTAPHAAIVLAFAARPAYSDGTLHDWASFLLAESQLKPAAVGTGPVGSRAGIVGEGTQDSELGPLVVRFAFTEDGGRLINLTYTCPEELDSAVRDVWFQAIATFELANGRGTSVPLVSVQEPVSSDATDASALDDGEPAAAPRHADEAEQTSSASRNTAPYPTDDHQPAWWRRAVELEAEDRLEEAEETIQRGAQHIGGAASVAQLYANRMTRLQRLGDEQGARDAFRKAEQWIFFSASQATSGGEGAALSRERDQFLAQLVNLHGGDPAEG